MSGWNTERLDSLSPQDIEDLLDMYWYLLMMVEGNVKEGDALDRHAVNSAHSILRRLKVANTYARWQKKQPDTVMIKKES